MTGSTSMRWIWVLPLLIAGCGIPPAAPKNTPTPGAINPTAERLHDIEGSLLLFHGAYRRMPTSMDELCLVTGLDVDRTVDPVSGDPFEYDPRGYARSPSTGVIVLLAQPGAPNDPCWAVAVKNDGAMVTCRVVPLETKAWAALTAGRRRAEPAPSLHPPVEEGP